MKKYAHNAGVLLLITALLALTSILPGCGGATAGGTSGQMVDNTVTATVPVVTSVSSDVSPGSACTVTGSNFNATRECGFYRFGSPKDSNNSYVTFVNTTDSTSTMKATSYSTWSNTKIVCVVPNLTAGASYSVVVTVVTSLSSASSTTTASGSNTITVTPQTPVISGISPAIINQGATTPITITGSYFGSIQKTGYVLFGAAIGGGAQYTTSSWNANQIVCTVPSTVTESSSLPVYVVTGDNKTSNAYTFAVASATAPIITSISPNSVALGSSPTITIAGNNLGSTQGTVTFQSGTSTPVTVSTTTSWSASQVVCVMPSTVTATAGSVTVTVNSSGTATNSLTVTVGATGKIYALFVGINAYQSITPLEQCVNDVNGMEANLTSSNAWSGADIVTLTDAQATKSAITSAISAQGAKAGASDIFFFYYSGHGSSSGSNAYICPVDTSSSDASTFFSDTELLALVNSMNSSTKKCFIFDSCHSGGFVGKDNLKSRYYPFPTTAKTLYTGGMERSLAGVANMVFIAAAQGDQTSLEDPSLGHGVFTYYYMEGLGTGTNIGPAAATGSTFITAQQGFTYASPLTVANVGSDHQPVEQDNYTTGLVIKQ